MNNSTAVCPAVGSTSVYDSLRNNPTIYHIACFGVYQTGPVGDNITHTLENCCNSTVVVTRNDDPRPGNCVFYCNVTRSNDDFFDDNSPHDFWIVQQCMQYHTADYDNEIFGYSNNKLRIQCFPKMERSAAVRSSRSLSTLEFGAVVLVAGAMVLG